MSLTKHGQLWATSADPLDTVHTSYIFSSEIRYRYPLCVSAHGNDQVLSRALYHFLSDEITLTPFAFRYLSDPSHRETYESAHSVVLSIFSSYAQQLQLDPDPRLTTTHDDRLAESTQFVHRMVPFYAQCLLQVSLFS